MSITSSINPQTRIVFDEFIGWLTHDKRSSIYTIKNYQIDLELLFSTHPDYQKISEFDIRRKIAKLHANGISPKSLARYLSAWRSFYNYLLNNGKIIENPVAKVHPPKSAKHLPETLSVEQVNGMLNRQSDDIEEIRDMAVFELLYNAGLRLSELVQINMADVKNIFAGELVVLGKRQKKRPVPIGEKAINALQKWLKVRRQITTLSPQKKLKKDDDLANNVDINSDLAPLFINKKSKRLSGRAIELSLARFAKKCGMPFQVYPHMLRHSFASHVLQSSGDLRAVQEMLGHESIAATQIYTHLDFDHLAKIYDKAHPRALIKN